MSTFANSKDILSTIASWSTQLKSFFQEFLSLKEDVVTNTEDLAVLRVEFDALAAGGVTSVNGATGTVVLDADDIDDTATTNKFLTGSVSTGWTVTNEVSTKTLNANATSVNELADILGTLIEDLKTRGVISG